MTACHNNIAVIGAGIGGLTLALALRQAGFDPQIYERAAELREAGTAIALWPNATRILKHLGRLDDLLECSSLITECEIRTFKNKLIRRWSIPKFSTPAIFTHRADLHAVLAGAVPAEKIHLGKTALRLEETDENVRVFFHDGSRLDCAVLIGADGLHSAIRDALHGPQAPLYQGYTIWRAIIPADASLLKPGLKKEWWGPGVRFGLAHNGRGRMNWYIAANRKTGQVDDLTHGWPHPIPEMIKASSQILKTDIWARPPSSAWGRGRTTLLGDAAHPTTPNLGQGAGMAIEDALVLAQELAREALSPKALRLYEKLRYQRTSATTNLSKFVGEMGQWSQPAAVALRTLFLKNCPAFLWSKKLKAAYSCPVSFEDSAS